MLSPAGLANYARTSTKRTDGLKDWRMRHERQRHSAAETREAIRADSHSRAVPRVRRVRGGLRVSRPRPPSRQADGVRSGHRQGRAELPGRLDSSASKGDIGVISPTVTLSLAAEKLSPTISSL